MIRALLTPVSVNDSELRAPVPDSWEGEESHETHSLCTSILLTCLTKYISREVFRILPLASRNLLGQPSQPI